MIRKNPAKNPAESGDAAGFYANGARNDAAAIKKIAAAALFLSAPTRDRRNHRRRILRSIPAMIANPRTGQRDRQSEARLSALRDLMKRHA